MVRSAPSGTVSCSGSCPSVCRDECFLELVIWSLLGFAARQRRWCGLHTQKMHGGQFALEPSTLGLCRSARRRADSTPLYAHDPRRIRRRQRVAMSFNSTLLFYVQWWEFRGGRSRNNRLAGGHPTWRACAARSTLRRQVRSSAVRNFGVASATWVRDAVSGSVFNT